MADKRIDTGYKPRKIQAYCHQMFRRFNVVVCHRRLGKTVMFVNEAIQKGLENNKKNPQYAYIAPTYSQAKRIAWDYFKEYTKEFPGVQTNEAELRIEIPRPDRGDVIRFVLLGAENFDSIRGMYFDGVVFDEFGMMSPEIWGKVIRPALSDRLGWAIFGGTPEGINHFKHVYDRAKEPDADDWFSAIFKASETKIIPQSELDEARKAMSEEEYEQEFECAWTGALAAGYFSREMSKARKEGRVRSVPYERAKPVYTYWDLGISDSTAIWFMQEVGGEFHLIDYHEDSGPDLISYAKVLKEKGYFYSDHNVPHDAGARELGSGRTKEEIFREALSTIQLKGQRLNVLPRYTFDDTINAVKMILNKCYFDAEKCKRGIECLENYQRKWDTKNLNWSSLPLHNWASHGADGFRMLGMSYREESRRVKDEDLQREHKSDYNIFDY